MTNVNAQPAKTPCDLCGLLERILTIVPESETKLRARLISVQVSAAYAPPESMWRWWTLAGQVLGELVDPHVQTGTKWALRVRDIFTEGT